MIEINVGLSPCPNDTFIFHALLEGLVGDEKFRFRPVFEDVEKLNQMALDSRLDVTKISFHAYAYLQDSYRLLRAGSALGRGCGPLLVCRQGNENLDLETARVAIPGSLTSATLLLRLYAPRLPASNLEVMPFDQILEAVASGRVDAGLIIHESRFTYARHGLMEKEDLGRWWEQAHHHPIPLGGIIAHHRLGDATIDRVDALLRQSIEHARARPEDSLEFIRSHAQEMESDVTKAHIDLYVNEFSVDLGDEGLAAVDYLVEKANQSGILDLR